jgi:hypothetical protein
MVVWGGINYGGQLNTGGRYNPSNDTWQSTSLVNAPTARSLFTAVSDSSTMIVWGGISVSTNLNTGGRYDPGTDVWTPTSTVNAPAGRTDHTAVWTGTKMIVWGGETNWYSNTGGRYDPTNDSWAATSTTNAASIRSRHGAVWTGTRMIIWGGYPAGQTGGRYDPATDTWIATGGVAPMASQWTAAVWTGDRMLVWGAGSGGQYMLPDSAADADGDGWSPCAGDCNDANAAVGPGVPELCNGVDDNCDGLIDNAGPVPHGAPFLWEAREGDVMQLSWTAVSGATGYDVVKGDLGNLRGSAGNYTTSTASCVVNRVGVTAAQDLEIPAAGEAIWYLIRAVNACTGHGTYDEGVLSQEGSRDAKIDAAPAACP